MAGVPVAGRAMLSFFALAVLACAPSMMRAVGATNPCAGHRNVVNGVDTTEMDNDNIWSDGTAHFIITGCGNTYNNNNEAQLPNPHRKVITGSDNVIDSNWLSNSDSSINTVFITGSNNTLIANDVARIDLTQAFGNDIVDNTVVSIGGSGPLFFNHSNLSTVFNNVAQFIEFNNDSSNDVEGNVAVSDIYISESHNITLLNNSAALSITLIQTMNGDVESNVAGSDIYISESHNITLLNNSAAVRITLIQTMNGDVESNVAGSDIGIRESHNITLLNNSAGGAIAVIKKMNEDVEGNVVRVEISIDGGAGSDTVRAWQRAEACV
jgi:hypothetical protein